MQMRRLEKTQSAVWHALHLHFQFQFQIQVEAEAEVQVECGSALTSLSSGALRRILMGSNLADLSDIARAEVSKVSFPKDAMVVFAALLFLNVKVAKYAFIAMGMVGTLPTV